jgi:hypothetical protein
MAQPSVKVPKSDKPLPTPRKRVVGWLTELAQAGQDMGRAKALLNKVRDDVRASKADREHFCRALAQQSLAWYMGAVRGKPLAPEEIKEMASARGGKKG